MADSTIGNLPVAGTLDGTELLPAVQGGVTKRTTVGAVRGTVGQFTAPVVVKEETVSDILLTLLTTQAAASKLQLTVHMNAITSGEVGLDCHAFTVSSVTLPRMSLTLSTVSNSTEALALQIRGTDASTADVQATTGSFIVHRAGQGLQVKEGSNAKQGTATLTAGTAVVSNTSVTANSRIFLTAQNLGTVTTPKALAVTARTAGVNFTITSADNTDTSVVAWEIFEPAP